MKEEKILSIDQFISLIKNKRIEIKAIKNPNEQDIQVELEKDENGNMRLIRYKLLKLSQKSEWVDEIDLNIESAKDFFDELLLQKRSFRLNKQGDFDGLRFLPLLPLSLLNDHWEFVSEGNSAYLLYADLIEGKVTYNMGFRNEEEGSYALETPEAIPTFWQEIYEQFANKKINLNQRNQIVVLAAIKAQMPDICTKYGWNVEEDNGKVILKSPSGALIDLDSLEVRFDSKQNAEVFMPMQDGKEYNLTEEVDFEMQKRMSDGLEL